MGSRLLERCPRCRGIWLTHVQLKEILEQLCDQGKETVESDGHADIADTFAPSRVLRNCPTCEAQMENFKFEETGIWIDACPGGHGIWLDQGELRLLAQKRPEGQDYDTGEVMDAVSDLILGSL